MYIVINKTKNTTTKYSGNFPNVDDDLNAGNSIIIISLYSNTIKVPHLVTEYNTYGINEYDWEDFTFDPSFK